MAESMVSRLCVFAGRSHIVRLKYAFLKNNRIYHEAHEEHEEKRDLQRRCALIVFVNFVSFVVGIQK